MKLKKFHEIKKKIHSNAIPLTSAKMYKLDMSVYLYSFFH